MSLWHLRKQTKKYITSDQKNLLKQFSLMCTCTSNKTDHQIHLVWRRLAVGLGGEGANGDFVRSASSVRSFPDQGHMSAVEEKGGGQWWLSLPPCIPCSFSLLYFPETEQQSWPQLVSTQRGEWMESTWMKESRRCVFSDLEHLVQAHTDSQKALTHLWCFVCINGSTNMINIGAVLQVLGTMKMC